MKKGAIVERLRKQVAELQKDLRIEMNAKSEAYDFIVSNGQLDKFYDWSFQHRGEDHHFNCITKLLSL